MKRLILLLIVFNFISITAYAENYTIYDTSSDNFSQSGSFTEGNMLGFGNKKLSCSDENGSKQQWDLSIDQNVGFYKVYYYFTPILGGDTRVKINCSTYINEFERYDDFSEGVFGWREIGAFKFIDYAAHGKLSVSFEGSGNGKFGVSAVKMVKVDEEEVEFYEFFSRMSSNAMIMKPECYFCYFNMIKKDIPETPPITVEDRTMVPLRFISENFGAEVTWDSSQNKAIISLDDKIITFAPNEKNFDINGEIKQSDVVPVIYNDRMLIPLRSFAESAGKNVYWEEKRRMIFIADSFVIDAFDDEKILDKIADRFERDIHYGESNQ